MALQSSGNPISLGDIQNEFGGSNPINISEYYRGGTYVPDTAANSDIPTDNTIKLSDFYGGNGEETAWRGIDFICEDNNISVALSGSNSFNLTATVTGGTGSFTYLWYNPDGTTTTIISSSRTVDSPSGKGIGVFSVTVTDSNSLKAYDTEQLNPQP